MNRDETIALFERCETARAAAMAKALADGKQEDEARDVVHEAARTVWNGWAEPLLAEREAMEANGRWAAGKDWRGNLEPQNDETRDWMARAAADFTRIHFLVRGVEATEVNAGEVKHDAAPEEPPVKTLSVEDGAVNFSGFKFPGDALFGSTTFSGDALFDSATFSGDASFGSAAFSGDASFGSATFSGSASFDSATFSGDASFDSATFSGTAWFIHATFSGDARFDSAAFSGNASFGSATFSGDALFDSAAFSGDASFDSATVSGKAWFFSTNFSGTALFDSATFSGDARFIHATFSGDARFTGAMFSGTWFGSATFSGDARLTNATFSGDAWFDSAAFSGDAWFDSATFSGNARFDNATFSGTASFGSATFSGTARFDSATFSGTWFTSATFSGNAWFTSATFSGDTLFDSATFSGDASFDSATFSGTARFDSATFSRVNFKEARFYKAAFFSDARFAENAVFETARFASNAFFVRAVFQDTADFSLVKFDQYADFGRVQFHCAANFNAVRGDRAFSLAEVTFEHVPDFIQAHFEEAPRLDNLTVVARMIPAFPALGRRKGENGEDIEPTRIQKTRHWLKRKRTLPSRILRGVWPRLMNADRDIPARWRALKRLALQAHDQDREHEFFAQEIRSARFAGDWPVPWPVWKASVWLGFFRFWFGILYGLFSNYGRSVARPALWWFLGVAVAAVFYLGEQPGMAWQRALAEHRGAVSPYAATTLEAWRQRRPCYEPRPRPTAFTSGEVSVIALSEKLRAQTSAPYEALQLALRDGFLFLYGDADTAHRTYGCLFGVELYGGGTPVAIVPPQIGMWSALHKLYSAIMIFLFGLALRNMLKMK
jgi:hypothetical protein